MYSNVNARVDALLSSAYLDRRAAQLNGTALASVAAGGVAEGIPAYVATDPALFDPLASVIVPAPGPLMLAQRAERDEDWNTTSSLAIVDGHGNAPAMTTTINTHWGAHIDAGGMMLNNAMSNFSADAVGGDVNGYAPNKRARSSIAPAIALDAQGRVVLAWGAAGGGPIPDYIVKTFLANQVYGMDIQAAINADNWTGQGAANSVAQLERGKPVTQLIAGMRSRYGYTAGTLNETGLTSGLAGIAVSYGTDGRAPYRARPFSATQPTASPAPSRPAAHWPRRSPPPCAGTNAWRTSTRAGWTACWRSAPAPRWRACGTSVIRMCRRGRRMSFGVWMRWCSGWRATRSRRGDWPHDRGPHTHADLRAMPTPFPHGVMGQPEIDEAYDPLRRAADAAASNRQLAERSEQARRELPHRLRVAYGPTRAEAQDISPADVPGASVFGFLHGGYLEPAIQLDDGIVQRSSPVRHVRRCATPVVLAWGGAEQDAFSQQSHGFHAAWRAAGNRSAPVPVDGADHLQAVQGFEQPDSALCQALRGSV